MVGLPADTLARQGQQSGQITCYEQRTDHVLSTRLRPYLAAVSPPAYHRVSRRQML